MVMIGTQVELAKLLTKFSQISRLVEKVIVKLILHTPGVFSIYPRRSARAARRVVLGHLRATL